LSVAILLTTAVPAQNREKLRPVDEGTKNASFAHFRSQLVRALESRDSAFVRSILDPQILVSLGGEYGRADFEANWKLDDPMSKFWSEMQRVLSLGGTLGPDGRGFTAPYVFSCWPDEHDAFEHVAVILPAAALRSRPSKSAPAVLRFSYDILRLATAPEEPPAGWVFVETLDRTRRGYVPADRVRSPIDYRAFFERREDKWFLTVFVAGD
jgi:hypothetical protein